MASSIKIFLLFYVTFVIFQSSEGCCCSHWFMMAWCGCNMWGCNCDYKGIGTDNPKNRCYYNKWFADGDASNDCQASDEYACAPSARSISKVI